MRSVGSPTASGFQLGFGRIGSKRQADQQQRAMHLHLAARGQAPDQEMGVGVAGQQRDLEEQHGRGPHRGGSAEPRQNDLGDERLHLKQEEGAQENGERRKESWQFWS